MRFFVTIVGITLLAGLTGCQCGPGGLLGGGIRGAGGCETGCESGNCGLLSRLGSGRGCGAGSGGGLLGRFGPNGGACAETDGEMSPGYFAGGAYPGNLGGPLADKLAYKHRAHQSHMGAYPGPAQGAPAPTYSYPYYTTRGPRDFLSANPPSIGY